MYGFAQVVVSGPMHTHEYAWLGAITANGDGTYTGAYNTTMCGYYALRVEMGPTEGVAGSGVPLPTDDNGDWYNVFNSGNYDKYMAKGSPYKAYVNPGATVASMSYAYDAPDLLDNNDLQVSIDPFSKSELWASDASNTSRVPLCTRHHGLGSRFTIHIHRAARAQGHIREGVTFTVYDSEY